MRARLRTDAAVLVPGLLAIGLIVLWATYAGGYPVQVGDGPSFDPDPWSLGALAAVGLLAATLAGLGAGRLHLGRAGGLALGAFGLYVAFSYLSITWAPVPGDALDGANRALVYFAILTLFTVAPWQPSSARVALAAFAIGGGIVALGTALRLGTAPHPSHGFYIDGRLASPLSYQNATAAFFTMVALVGVGVGSRRRISFPARGLALTAAALSLQLAVLAQSRGWLFTLPLVLIAVVALVPDRLRLALFAGLPVLATLAILSPLLDVFRAAGYHGTLLPAATVDHLLASKGTSATEAILVADSVLLVLATLAAFFDARVRMPARVGVRATRGAALGAVLLALGGAGAGLIAVHGDVGGKLDRAWTEFKHFEPSGEAGNRFGRLGSSRYDFWRVSLDIVADHPLGGIGQDNFAEAYLQKRHSEEDTRTTHSLELRLLVHTGILGALLFAGFLGAALSGALRGRGSRWRRNPDPVALDSARVSTAGIALLPLAVWLIHGSVDWFWEFPTLSGAALGLLGIALALTRKEPAPEKPLRPARRLVAWAAALALALGGLVVLAIPFFGERDVVAALAARDTSLARSLSDLDRAADLEGLSARPSLVAGLLALRRDRTDLATPRLEQALSRNKRSFLASYVLGLLASARHDDRAAAALLTRARDLDPGDSGAQTALTRLRNGRPFTLSEGLLAITTRYRRRFGP
jgi:O-antigen ligase